jgi:hypothetical protein
MTRLQSLVLLVLAVVACVAMVDAAPLDPILSNLHRAISDACTAHRNNGVFVFQAPGIGVNSDKFDTGVWFKQGEVGNSPAFNLDVLLNAVPSVGTSFTSSYNLAERWQHLHVQYQTRDRRWETENCQQLGLYPALATMTTSTALLQQNQYVVGNATSTLYKRCTRVFDLAECGKRETVWQAMRDAAASSHMWLQSLTTIRESHQQKLSKRVTSVRMGRSASTLQSGMRTQGSGGTFAQTYLYPLTWNTWFAAGANVKDFGSFSKVTLKTSTPALENSAWDALGGQSTMALLTKALSLITPSADISFEVATAKVFRPWFDQATYTIRPMVLTSSRMRGWSSGRIDVKFNVGQTPMYIHEMVIIRRLTITSDTWSRDPRDALLSVDLGTIQSGLAPSPVFKVTNSTNTTQVLPGPFSINTDFYSFTSPYTRRVSIRSIANGVAVDDPQIIGWICRGVRLFPNHEITASSTKLQTCAVPFGTPPPTPPPYPTAFPTPTPFVFL